MVNKFYAVTVATKKGGYYDCLIQSCKTNNIDLVTLGWGDKWQGFAWRWKLYKDFIKNLNDNDIVLWIDAYDVLIMDKKRIIINKFKKFNTGVVFGADESIISNVAFNNCNKPILNGGSHIGYAKYIKVLVELMLDNNLSTKWNNDDQNMLNEINCTKDFFNEHTKSDIDSNIFYVSRVNDRLSLDYIFNKQFADNKSSIIHGSGGFDMTAYASKLKCNLNDIESADKEFKIDQALNIIANIFYLHRNTFCIIVMLLIVTFIVYRK